MTYPSPRHLQIDLPDEGGRPPKDGAKKNTFRIKLMLVATIDVRELHRFLEKRGPFTSACATVIQALNVVMVHKPFSEKANGIAFCFALLVATAWPGPAFAN